MNLNDITQRLDQAFRQSYIPVQPASYEGPQLNQLTDPSPRGVPLPSPIQTPASAAPARHGPLKLVKERPAYLTGPLPTSFTIWVTPGAINGILATNWETFDVTLGSGERHVYADCDVASTSLLNEFAITSWTLVDYATPQLALDLYDGSVAPRKRNSSFLIFLGSIIFTGESISTGEGNIALTESKTTFGTHVGNYTFTTSINVSRV